MPAKLFPIISLAAFGTTVAACSSVKLTRVRTGNIEEVRSEDDGKVQYRLKYTFDGDRKIKGEYFAEDKTEAEVTREVKYDEGGRVVRISHRAKMSLPVVGDVQDEYDLDLTYGDSGLLLEVKQTNITPFTIASNLTPVNVITFTYDSSGRLEKVVKLCPPTPEVTTYTYGAGQSMKRTKFDKIGLDTASKKIRVLERVVVDYSDGIPWSGKAKYDFSAAVEQFAIYDPDTGEATLKLDFSSPIEAAKSTAALGSLINNESKGPMWRMGTIPEQWDEPFAEQGAFKWY